MEENFNLKILFRSKNCQKIFGFSFIEILVVMTIVGIMLALAIPTYKAATERDILAEGIIYMDALAKEMTVYYAFHDEYPDFDDLNLGDGWLAFIEGDYPDYKRGLIYYAFHDELPAVGNHPSKVAQAKATAGVFQLDNLFIKEAAAIDCIDNPCDPSCGGCEDGGGGGGDGDATPTPTPLPEESSTVHYEEGAVTTWLMLVDFPEVDRQSVILTFEALGENSGAIIMVELNQGNTGYSVSFNTPG